MAYKSVNRLKNSANNKILEELSSNLTQREN